MGLQKRRLNINSHSNVFSNKKKEEEVHPSRVKARAYFSEVLRAVCQRIAHIITDLAFSYCSAPVFCRFFLTASRRPSVHRSHSERAAHLIER